MVPNPDLIHYVCIARGTIVLAELNTKDSTLGTMAAKCLENTPPYHSTFTHTVRSKTYSYLIVDSVVYFAIFDKTLEKSEGFAFLKCVKDAFEEIFKGERKLENLKPHCFQEELNPVFLRLLGAKLDRIGTLTRQGIDLTKPNGEKGVTKMMNRSSGELKNNGENDGNGIDLSHEFQLMLHRNRGLYSAELTGHHQRAKKVWKKQVWVVLSLDLIMCVMLFGVWLWVCRGLKCIES